MFGIGIQELAILGGICLVFVMVPAVIVIVIVMASSKKNQKDD